MQLTRNEQTQSKNSEEKNQIQKQIKTTTTKWLKGFDILVIKINGGGMYLTI